MNYEVQQALERKADAWQLDELKRQVESLKNENYSLKEKIERAESRISNYYSAMDKLLQTIIESENFEDVNQLHEIRQYL
jgi:uncharacterized coiled-coil DUF342 family protein